MSYDSKHETKYSAIMIDTDLDSRMRLKQAMSAVYQFGKTLQSSSITEALGKIESGVEHIDVIFLSSRFAQSEITSFIAKAKASKLSQDAAFVLILGTQKQDSASVAQNVMIGADGFLFEPYSVDQLLEITRIAARVKRERSETRERTALRLLVQDVIGQIDQISYVRSARVDSGTGMKKLKELCSMFHSLGSEKLDIYFESAIKAFEEAPLPKAIPQQRKYAGVSNRIKKKLEEKIIADMANTSPEAK